MTAFYCSKACTRRIVSAECACAAVTGRIEIDCAAKVNYEWHEMWSQRQERLSSVIIRTHLLSHSTVIHVSIHSTALGSSTSETCDPVGSSTHDRTSSVEILWEYCQPYTKNMGMVLPNGGSESSSPSILLLWACQAYHVSSKTGHHGDLGTRTDSILEKDPERDP